MKQLAALTIATTVLAGGLRVAHAQPSEPERLYTSGQKAYDEKRYDDALAAWERSYSLSKLPALLFNIAQAYRLRAQTGDCTKATETYKKFIELDAKSQFRAQADGFIAELAPCYAAENPSKVVEKKPVEPPKPPIVTGPGDKDKLPPPPPPPPGGGGGARRAIGFSVIGLGGVAVLGGVLFGVKASSLGKEVTDACAAGCDWNTIKDKDADGRSAATTQWILYGVGAAAIGVGAAIAFLGGSKKERSRTVTVVPHGDGALVGWSGRW